MSISYSAIPVYCYSVSYASDCMDQFVKKFTDKLMKSMKNSEFEAQVGALSLSEAVCTIREELHHTVLSIQVNSLIQAKLEPDFNMDTEVKRNWAELMHRQYKFDRNIVAAGILKTITQEQVCDWLKQYTKPGPDYRRLAVRVSVRPCS